MQFPYLKQKKYVYYKKSSELFGQYINAKVNCHYMKHIKRIR